VRLKADAMASLT